MKRLSPPPRRRASPRCSRLAPFLMLVAGWALACATPPRERLVRDDSPPLVLLISLDTFRADLLLRNGASAPSITPALDRLVADSVIFAKCFAQYPHTLPSHMSILTGLYPATHGVETAEDKKPAGISTLAQHLQSAGYSTVGIVTSHWLKPEFGFGQGFTHYELLPHQLTFADRVNETALGYMKRRNKSTDPQLQFLHYYDVHSDSLEDGGTNLPYYSPPEYREGLAVSSTGDEFCNGEYCSTSYLINADIDERALDSAELDKIVDLYRAGAEYLDHEIGNLLSELKAQDHYDDALIVLTADHGEEFREHGRFLHSQPYDETMAVPLIIKFPESWQAGLRVETVVETIDILPTVLEVVGLPVPDEVQGVSLLSLINGKLAPRDRALSRDSMIAHRIALRTSDYKLVAELGGARRELYDLRRDPGETVNQAAEQRELVEQLEKELTRLYRDNLRRRREYRVGEEEESGALSEDDRKILRALGYVN